MIWNSQSSGEASRHARWESIRGVRNRGWNTSNDKGHDVGERKNENTGET